MLPDDSRITGLARRGGDSGNTEGRVPSRADHTFNRLFVPPIPGCLYQGRSSLGRSPNEYARRLDKHKPLCEPLFAFAVRSQAMAQLSVVFLNMVVQTSRLKIVQLNTIAIFYDETKFRNSERIKIAGTIAQ